MAQRFNVRVVILTPAQAKERDCCMICRAQFATGQRRYTVTAPAVYRGGEVCGNCRETFTALVTEPDPSEQGGGGDATL